MLCSHPNISGKGFTFLPLRAYRRGKESGFPVELEQGHSLPLLWLIQAGQVPRLGSPFHPFSVPLKPSFAAQSLPKHRQFSALP